MSDSPKNTESYARPETGTSVVDPTLVRLVPPFRGDERGRAYVLARPDAQIVKQLVQPKLHDWLTSPLLEFDLMPDQYWLPPLAGMKPGDFTRMPWRSLIIHQKSEMICRARKCALGEHDEFLGRRVDDLVELEWWSGPRPVGSAFINNETAFLEECIWHDDGTILEYLINKCAAIVRYLSICNEHVVEVTQDEGTITPRQAKTARRKPWLSPATRRIILLDPLKARQYGHRIDRGGTHASPHPHQRLGHWANLRHERYKNKRGERIWVKPAWVGDREWVFEGNRYRVLSGAPQ